MNAGGSQFPAGFLDPRILMRGSSRSSGHGALEVRQCSGPSPASLVTGQVAGKATWRMDEMAKVVGAELFPEV